MTGTQSLIAFVLLPVFALGGCAKAPSEAKDPCAEELKACLKQFVSERMYCLVSGETASRCQELYDLGERDCLAMQEKCEDAKR